ncbi:hypothetical protein CAMSH0001_2047 [Campylobacter showae RM3277]|uniref:Uncharacterized protein n=1 Tax=Campylobacter showae RM3277 TaxID=553219 RepID=C6REF5_9BACT|nr:hypothetical protein CAMSH0001_2047 [Campylobacter showae RM3277]
MKFKFGFLAVNLKPNSESNLRRSNLDKFANFTCRDLYRKNAKIWFCQI